jgi:hypothetical protein
MTTELKCIEGWSAAVNWAGACLSDFAAAYDLGRRHALHSDGLSPSDFVDYVGLAIPRAARVRGRSQDE